MIAKIKTIDVNEVAYSVTYVLETQEGIRYYVIPMNRYDKLFKKGQLVRYTEYSNLYSNMIKSILPL